MVTKVHFSVNGKKDSKRVAPPKNGRTIRSLHKIHALPHVRTCIVGRFLGEVRSKPPLSQWFSNPKWVKTTEKIVKKIWHFTRLHRTRICQILSNVNSKNVPNVSFLAFPQERLILETWGWSQSIGNSILHQNTSFFNFGKVNSGCNGPANERKMQIFGVPKPPS